MDPPKSFLRRPRRGQSNDSVSNQSLIEMDDDEERRLRRLSRSNANQSLVENEEERVERSRQLIASILHQSLMDDEEDERQRRSSRSNASVLVNQSLMEMDNEEEKRLRRSIGQTRRSMSSNEPTPGTSKNSVEKALATLTNSTLTQKPVDFDDQELKMHFDLCQKLLQTNKITMKNAWTLHIIDYIMEIVEHKYCGNDTFQTAAVTMEICAKVYECRVDDLYLDGLKLQRALALAGTSNTEVLSDHEEQEEAAGGPKKAKKKSNKFELGINKRCICKNPKSLCGPIPQLSKYRFTLDIEGDPEQTENLCAFVVPIDHKYNDHLNDSENPGFLSYNIEDEVNTTVIGKCKPKLKRRLKICKDFQDFNMNKPDPNSDDTIIHTEAPMYDDNGDPIVELDGSFHNPFDEVNQDDTDDEEGAVGFCNVREVPITSFSPHQAALNAEGVPSGIDPDSSEWMKMVWIGPSHWKNKLVKPMAPIFSGKVEQQKGAKKKKKPEKKVARIDFTDQSLVDKIDFQDKVKIRKIRKNKKTLTVPRNHLLYEDMNKLSLFDYVPDHIVTGNPDPEEAFEHQPYDYDNLNDSQYCPDNAAGGDVDEPYPAHHEECHETNPAAERGDIPTAAIADQAEAGTSFDQSFHLSPPKPLYASKAKNVNMRKIREAMWKVISRGAIINEEKGTTTIKRTKFSTVYSTIMAEQPKSMTKDLTIQIAFFALLQIVQEGNISPKSTDDNSDVLILPFEEEKNRLPPY